MLKKCNQVLARCVGHGLKNERVEVQVISDPLTGEVTEKTSIRYLRSPNRVPSKNYSLSVALQTGQPLKRVNTVMFTPTQEEILELSAKLSEKVVKQETEN